MCAVVLLLLANTWINLSKKSWLTQKDNFVRKVNEINFFFFLVINAKYSTKVCKLILKKIYLGI